MNIAIIGAGQVGGALGRSLALAGHRIFYGLRDPQSPKAPPLLEATGAGASALALPEAVNAAGLILLATPWAATSEALQAAGRLTGKIVIDCTNPLKFTPGLGLELAIGFTDSGGEQVARWADGARVVKAFNTYGWENLADTRYPNGGNLRPLLFLAGDDAAAKQVVTGLGQELGFEPFDAGLLRAARELEPLALIWIRRAMSGDRQSGFTWARLTR